MVKNKKRGGRENESRLKSQTKHGILAVIFFVFALFLFISAFEMAGVAGIFIYEKLHYLLGVGYILLPVLFILLGSSFLKSETPYIGLTRTISAMMFLLSGLGMIDVASPNNSSGGLLGEILSTPFVFLFDAYASIIFLGAILIISILIMFDAKLELPQLFKKIWVMLMKMLGSRQLGTSEKMEDITTDEEDIEEKEEETAGDKIKNVLGLGKKNEEPQLDQEEEFAPKKLKSKAHGLKPSYTPPPLSILEEDKGKPNTGDIKANANIIKRTLANFGIEVEMDKIT